MNTNNNKKDRIKKAYSFRRVFGITILVCGALGGIILMSMWLVDVWQGESEFSWNMFTRITFLAFFLSIVGYFILKLSPADDL